MGQNNREVWGIEGSAGEKGNTWEERVEGSERKYTEGGPGAGMLNGILGREVRDKTESTGN